MVSSLTDSVYLNVRKRTVLCKAAVRLRRTLNCDFRHLFSMKPVDDRPTRPQATSTTAETHQMSCHLSQNPPL